LNVGSFGKLHVDVLCDYHAFKHSWWTSNRCS